jgi:hypothetical protein
VCARALSLTAIWYITFVEFVKYKDTNEEKSSLSKNTPVFLLSAGMISADEK